MWESIIESSFFYRMMTLNTPSSKWPDISEERALLPGSGGSKVIQYLALLSWISALACVWGLVTCYMCQVGGLSNCQCTTGEGTTEQKPTASPAGSAVSMLENLVFLSYKTKLCFFFRAPPRGYRLVGGIV